MITHFTIMGEHGFLAILLWFFLYSIAMDPGIFESQDVTSPPLTTIQILKITAEVINPALDMMPGAAFIMDP